MSRAAHLNGAQSLPEAITILVREAGSDDKFAAQLGTVRQTVIRWRKNGVYPEDYVIALRRLGVPSRLLRRRTPAEVNDRLHELEMELDQIRADNLSAIQLDDRTRRLEALVYDLAEGM